MLAEPKRKTVWSLNPRGKYWSEDKSKFGQKLLESMGWKEGLGLGKHNDGIQDNIKLNTNLDNKGLGYKPSFDSVWVDKNDDYEQLLANLAVHHNNGTNKHKLKVSNLEETSKKLRNRIHYSKFIKAKNLSQCSEKDLMSIFPKKRKNVDKPEMLEEPTESKKPDNTFESTTNMNDYFKSKMDKLKLRSKFNQMEANGDNRSEEHQITNENNAFKDQIESTSPTKKLKSQELSESSVIDSNICQNSNNSPNRKHKKSKKKPEVNEEEKVDQNSINCLNIELECQSTEEIMKKEKRKKKHKSTKVLDSEEMDSQSSSDCSKKSNDKFKLNAEKYTTIVPKGYNSNNMSVFESLKNYGKICAAIGRDKALSTTNLITLKGYGCHSH